jgi:hypothetical protein
MLRSTIARQEPCAIDRRSFPTLDELDRLLARENLDSRGEVLSVAPNRSKGKGRREAGPFPI